MLTDDQVAAAADHIRTKAETGYWSWRSNGELTTDAIQMRLAQVWVTACDEMASLEAQSTGDVEARRTQLLRQVFGVAGLPGDPASLAMSSRDAQERVAQIDPRDWYSAQQLLERAEFSGDEVLARAVAQAAYTAPLGGWGPVLDEFLASRPAAAKALAELASMQPPASAKSAFMNAVQFAVPKPAELAAVSDWAIRSMAAGVTQ